MNETKQLRWEQLYWFLHKDNDEDVIDFKNTFDDDYIVHDKKRNKVFMGSGGLVSTQDQNIWIGHTNFVLDKATYLPLLHNIPGVEAIQIVSKYRFEVCFGKLFIGSQLRAQIKDMLCSTNNKEWALVLTEDGAGKTLRGTRDELSKQILNQKVVKKSWSENIT